MPPVARKSPEGSKVIHFVEDGFLSFGRIWYAGDELEWVEDSPEYRATIDRRGFTPLSFADKSDAQLTRYNKVYFKSGAYQGKKFVEMNDMELYTVRASGNPIAPANQDAAERCDGMRRRQLGVL